MRLRVLWAEGNMELPINYFSMLVQLKSLGKTLMKDRLSREKYLNTFNEDNDYEKGFIVKFKDAHKLKYCSQRECYPP